MSDPNSSPLFTLTPGRGGLPKVALTALDGARAEIYLYGAHVTSWIPAGGEERLFLSQMSEFRPGTPIRGGVPVIFPQFSKLGPLPMHGFGRLTPWQFKGAKAGAGETVTARFELNETPASHDLWPHPFQAWLEVSLEGRKLTLALGVANSGETAFSFTAALHTYLRVAEIGAVRLGGLDGVPYLDSAAGRTRSIQAGPWLGFSGEVDRLYLGAAEPVHLQETEQDSLVVTKVGFPDVVAWNPGSGKGGTLADLEPPEGYRHMVCIEAAAAGDPVTLKPGETWHGSQTLSEAVPNQSA